MKFGTLMKLKKELPPPEPGREYSAPQGGLPIGSRMFYLKSVLESDMKVQRDSGEPQPFDVFATTMGPGAFYVCTPTVDRKDWWEEVKE